MYIFEYVEVYVCPYQRILTVRNEFQEFSLSSLYRVYVDSTIIRKSVVCLRRLLCLRLLCLCSAYCSYVDSTMLT